MRKVTLLLIALVLVGAQAATAAKPAKVMPATSAAATADGMHAPPGRGMSDGN